MTVEKSGRKFYVGSETGEICTRFNVMVFNEVDMDYYFDDEHDYGLYLTKEQAEYYSSCTGKDVTEGYWLIMENNYVRVFDKDALVNALYRLG